MFAVNVSDPWWANADVQERTRGTCLAGYEFDQEDAAALGVDNMVVLLSNPIDLPGLTNIVQKSIRYTVSNFASNASAFFYAGLSSSHALLCHGRA